MRKPETPSPGTLPGAGGAALVTRRGYTGGVAHFLEILIKFVPTPELLTAAANWRVGGTW